MMSTKCGLCKKSVYPNDSHLNLDSCQYHTGCAKCADCKCQITLANFTKSGDLLLCKTHYFERFNREGSYAGADKFKKSASANSAPIMPVSVAPVTSSMTKNEEPLSERATSVQDRLKQFGAGANTANKCAVCTKSVYPNDPQLVLDGNKYHQGCAKCTDCQCQINTSNFTRNGTTLYCKTHYLKRFREEGKFVGEEKFNRKRGEVSGDHLAGHSLLENSATPPEPPSNDDEKVKQEEEEAAAKQKAEEEEAAAKQQAEEEEAAAKQKAEEEEAAAKQQAEEEEAAAAKQKAEEEEAAVKQKAEEEEAAAAKQKAEEEEAAAKQQAEEEEAAAARQKADEEEAAAKQQAEEEEAAAAKLKAEEEEAAAAKLKAEEEEAAVEQSTEEAVIEQSTESGEVVAENNEEDETV